jgi:hypothetical protein
MNQNNVFLPVFICICSSWFFFDSSTWFVWPLLIAVSPDNAGLVGGHDIFLPYTRNFALGGTTHPLDFYFYRTLQPTMFQQEQQGTFSVTNMNS